jgi:hypothetical protein
MTDPLEHLTEIASEFRISYQRFKETGARYWTVTILGANQPPPGTGETLHEAICDMQRQCDLDEFRQALQHAAVGNKTLDEWKRKLRELV